MEKGYTNEKKIIKIDPPKKGDIITIRLLICIAAVLLIAFVSWFFRSEHVGFTPLFILLTLALVFKLVKMIHEWYHYWSVSVPVMPESNREWKVDMLTTSCPGEPRDMIIRTLKAMLAVTYPHTNYLCDEGNDPVLKKFCDENGIVHVTRTVKVDAKAGNINNALKQATGEICVVLDPDHEPIPEFLDRVLPYFENESIGFVQCVQAYGNQDESIIARGAAEQTYHFYGPMMMCMNSYGTVQAIGANCTFRRSALDSIGGHAAGLSEDMHTAMQLHAKGWKSIYVPEILTRGLVPATLSSYYKQQLKWSRGTFELLFRTFPALAKNFTWRQKIHYFTIPLYFLFGVINLIDIIIPIAALSMAEVPWEVDLGFFAVFFLPLCTLSMLIRLFAQRWLLEKHERGFHFAGGILRMATWWIFLVGFVYTIFKIKVPYIPTPKEDEHQNYWRLSFPNFLISVLCVLGVWYGLSLDWTPYSIAMAFYALMNALMLAVVVILSQQKLVLQFRTAMGRSRVISVACNTVAQLFSKGQGLVYNLAGNGPAVIIVALSLVFLSYNNIDDVQETSNRFKPKDFGGFFSGVSVADPSSGSVEYSAVSGILKNNFETISYSRTWNDSLPVIPATFVKSDNRSMPYINWSLDFSGDTATAFSQLVAGAKDLYLRKCADEFRSYSKPVFISFCPSFNKEQSAQRFSESYVRSWQYVYTFFNNLGISNLCWVWNPALSNAKLFYPGPKFTDWVGVSCLNYGASSKDDNWYSFSQLYEPYRTQLSSFGKPVMVSEFGTLTGPHQVAWINNSLSEIQKNFPEIRGLVFFDQKKDFTMKAGSRDSVYYSADFSLKGRENWAQVAPSLSREPFSNEPFKGIEVPAVATPAPHSRKIKGAPGKFELLVDGKPYYIRGVAYNTAHDWRDGNTPLTRRQVEKDFERIKAMGANTIRRYDHSIYDRNVLNIAAEFDLRVLYGFWFDPKVDYYTDSVRVKEYTDKVIEKVLEYKDHSSVLAWSLGNETWGQLKHRYSKPYLIEVRRSYVKMIETLAERIHEIDPERPVFTCIEHEEYQLPGEIVAFRDGAPSIDAVGVNSYYREQISKLNHVTWQFDSLRPYLVSEFGPRGYWDPSYNRTRNGKLIEDSEKEKALWYKDQWTNYVSSFKGYNIGGFAYCWHDRMEGSYTWFGLTDYKSRLKPGYYALKELWTNEKIQGLPQFSITMPDKLVAGQEYTCTATCAGLASQNYTYEWYLHKNDYLERVDAVESINEGQSVQLKVPQDHLNYRLYLYVSDDKGNVSTASAPVDVR